MMKETKRGTDGLGSEMLDKSTKEADAEVNSKKAADHKEQEAEQKEQGSFQLRIQMQSSDRSKLQAPTQIGCFGKKNDATASKAPAQNMLSTKTPQQSK